ncbi:MAG: MlaD family protein [Planctomycetes bacterium]|nr:MlaD family protein [Planctomycetota bacterium]
MQLKLGLFVAGALAILAGLIVFFGRAPELFSTKVRYTLLFPEAPGIGPGIPIRKSGVRIGEVSGVDLDVNTGQVRVQVRLEKKYLPRKSEDVIITKGILSGDTAIDLVPRLNEEGHPIPNGEEWPPDSDIPGLPPITPRSLLTPASGILANAQQSLDKVARAFERLEKFSTVQPKLEKALDEATETFKSVRTLVPEAKKTLDRLNNLLGADTPPNNPGGVVPASFIDNPGLALGQPQPIKPVTDPNIKDLIRDIQEVARTAKPAVDEMRAMIKRLEPDVTSAVKSARLTFDNVNEVLSPENKKQVSELLKNANAVALSIVRISAALTSILEGAEKSLKNIDTVVTSAGGVITDVREFTKPLAAKSEALVTGVTDSADQLNKALVEVRGLLATFGKGNGSVQKLLTDPGVYQNIDDAAGSLARVMAKAEKITRDLEVFADKIARRPELIGVGGAVRPSSGLKDAPGAMMPAYRPDWPPAAGARQSNSPNWLQPPANPNPNPNPPPVQGYPPR